ncbi:MAG: CheR family methyltransferase [Planctomycetota bacterium]
MEDAVFNRYRRVIREKAGISLSDKKRALVRGRVSKRMRALGIDDFGSYLDRVEEDSSQAELTELLDAISTNVTRFFREPEHFEFLAEVVSQWRQNGQVKFRFWSAACSTGEEPYTMAMVLSDVFPDTGIDWKILATDISTQVLRTASEGVYKEKKLEKVDDSRKKRFFRKKRSEGDNLYSVSSKLHQKIIFRRLNLSEPPYPMQGPMDVIFVRNVMIYFDNAVRNRLLKEVYRLLRPNGYLVVGHAESLTGCLSNFESIRPSIYIKR